MTPLPSDRQLARAGFDQIPAAIAAAGEAATWRFIEFFTANIRNANTRRAYARAVGDFLRWCDMRRVHNRGHISPTVVAAYVEQRGVVHVNTHLFDRTVTRGAQLLSIPAYKQLSKIKEQLDSSAVVRDQRVRLPLLPAASGPRPCLSEVVRRHASCPSVHLNILCTAWGAGELHPRV